MAATADEATGGVGGAGGGAVIDTGCGITFAANAALDGGASAKLARVSPRAPGAM
jgi:hypothetical protein